MTAARWTVVASLCLVMGCGVGPAASELQEELAVTSQAGVWSFFNTESCSDLCNDSACACIQSPPACPANPEGKTCSTVGDHCIVKGSPVHHLSEYECVSAPPPPPPPPPPGTRRVAVIPFYYNSTVSSMNNPVGKPPAWGAPASGWDVLGVYFTGAGKDPASGSAKGYWSEVSNGSINITGNIFPWTAVRNAGTVDAPRNYRPLYLWFDSSLPQYSAYASGGQCIGGWELDASNNIVNVPARNLATEGKCLCRDVPAVSPHYVEVACNGSCPDGSPTSAPQPASTFYVASTGATWCRVAAEGGSPQVAAIQGSIPSTGVNTKDQAGNTQSIAFNAANYDAIVYAYPEVFGGTGGPGMPTTWASLASRGYAFYNASHELGHNLGLQHSADRVCASGGINRNTDPVSATGTAMTLDSEANCYAWLDLGDCCSGYGAYSVMGGSDYVNHINGYQKLVAGALDPSALTTITSSGTYALNRSTSTSGTRLLRISTLRSPGPAYHYLEYRTAVANTFESNLPPGMQGITLTMAPDYATSSYPELLDAHPGTFNDFSDAALKPGDSFTDPGRGFVSQVASASPTSAAIDISFRPTNTNLFAYRAATGERWVYWQDSAGLRTLKTTFPNAWTEWTHVAGCNGHGLLYYKTGTGAAWGAFVGANGFPTSTGALTLPAGFTQVTCAGKGNLFLYNSSTGGYQTGTITSDGIFTQGPSGTLDAGWTAVAGTASGKVVLYGRSVPLSPLLKQYRVASLDSAGQFSPWSSGTTSSGYTIIAPVRDNGLLFYKASSGALHPAKIDDQGRITWVNTTGSTNAGYTDIVGGQNGSLTLYNSGTGFFDTSTVSSTFNIPGVAWGSAATGMKLTGVGGY